MSETQHTPATHQGADAMNRAADAARDAAQEPRQGTRRLSGPFAHARQLLESNRSYLDSLMAERDRLEIEITDISARIADIDLCLNTVAGNIAQIESNPDLRKTLSKDSSTSA